MASRPTPPADPLADLREQTPPASGVTLTQPTPPDDPAPDLDLLELHDQLWHDGAVGVTVQAWHDDETAASMVHRPGGGCSCRYLARLAVQAIHGDPTPDPEPDDDDDPQED